MLSMFFRPVLNEESIYPWRQSAPMILFRPVPQSFDSITALSVDFSNHRLLTADCQSWAWENTQPVVSTLVAVLGGKCWASSHEIITESWNHLGWKRPLISLSPNIYPALLGPALNYVHKCYKYLSFKCFQGWWYHHFPEHPVPMLVW